MILAAVHVADVKIHRAHALAQRHMCGGQPDQADAIRVEQYDMILFDGFWPSVVESRKEPVNDARTVGVEVVADRWHRQVADYHWFLDKVVVTEAVHGVRRGLLCELNG